MPLEKIRNAGFYVPIQLLVENAAVAKLYGSDILNVIDGGVTGEVDWYANGGVQILELNGNVTAQFTAPHQAIQPFSIGHARLILLVKTHPSTGAIDQITWPASVRWPGGVAPTINTGNNRMHVIEFDYVQSLNLYFGRSSGDYAAT